MLVPTPEYKKTHGPRGSMSSFSGIRESDPPHKLGKLVHYRCANAASDAILLVFNYSINYGFLVLPEVCVQEEQHGFPESLRL